MKDKIPGRHPEKELTAVKVRNAQPGRYADGNCLFLVVDDNGARRWVLRVMAQGKRHDIGLGATSYVNLQDARELAAKYRRIAREGGDPLVERRAGKLEATTFEEAAREAFAHLSGTFTNVKHAAQWIKTMETYAFPIMGARRIGAITSTDILSVLSPIWNAKAETARRVKQRMSAIFDRARGRGLYIGGNPVYGIEKALSKHDNGKAHFSAMPYQEIPQFIADLRNSSAGEAVKLALEFTILTAARTSEVIYAKWNEIDFTKKMWTVPAGRMKAGVEHRVPLADRCLEILTAARKDGEYIFPGARAGQPLSNMAMLDRLKTMRPGYTVHGFRSAFRNWSEEHSRVQRSTIEKALAHVVQNKTEAAYLRTDMYQHRIPLMAAWSAYATAKPSQKVVKIQSA